MFTLADVAKSVRNCLFKLRKMFKLLSGSEPKILQKRVSRKLIQQDIIFGHNPMRPWTSCQEFNFSKIGSSTKEKHKLILIFDHFIFQVNVGTFTDSVNDISQIKFILNEISFVIIKLFGKNLFLLIN